MKLCRAKQSLATEFDTIQLSQFRDCMTYSAFRCTISQVKFTLTNRDLLIHRPYAEVLENMRRSLRHLGPHYRELTWGLIVTCNDLERSVKVMQAFR